MIVATREGHGLWKEEIGAAHGRSVVRLEDVERLFHRADDIKIRLRLETDMRIADLDE
jgi:hypothetical protein